jgi:hypothetical protein
MRALYFGLLLLLFTLPIVCQTTPLVIEDFESGTIDLSSWADEDIQPDAWSLDTSNTHSNSVYSLKLSGNTWKEQAISPLAAQINTVIEVAAYYSTGATVQGIGFSDGENHLFYSISGSRILDLEVWVPVYQGAYNANSWNLYRLPLGADWESFFGYYPTITSLIYVNDLDQSSPRSVWFDSIYDITSTLPISPQVSITTQIPSNHNNRFVGVQFSATIIDPDSNEFSYHWSFGDGNHSSQSSPYHVYDIIDAHEYTVNLRLTDESGMVGLAATQVNIDPGPSTLPLTMNFVGDVMLARRYDTQIIPVQGIEAIFQPTLAMLGDAADVTIANLEVVLANTGTPHPTKSVVYRGNPNNVAGLVYAGIDNVSLANNHTLDYGLPALRQTQSLLDANGIGHSGSGANAYEAYLPSFINQKGLSIALLRSSDRTGQYNNTQPFLQAGYAKEGFAYMTPYYNMMQLAAVQGIADLKVVEMHGGSEYSTGPGSDYGKNNPFIGDDQDEDYTYRYDVPHQWDREIRQTAVDNGADLVIVHHPHIIHGMELYNGKVIAHSLGNFAFDLDYPECMHSVIFYADAYPDGFRNHHVRPVYIDGYIPKPAMGHLGLYTLDYVAMKSRELDTIVVVDKEALTASIPLNPEALTQTLHPFHIKPPFAIYEQDWQQTAPIKLPRFGSISSVDELGPAVDAELRLGTELIWFGNFEDEGSSLWEVPEYSAAGSLDGERSAFFSSSNGGSQTGTIAKKMKIYDNQKSYTLHGWIRTRNVQSANITIRYYSARNSYSPISTEDVALNLSGTNAWQWYFKELNMPSNAWYYDIRLSFTGVSTELSQAWFDNVGLIEWNPWQTQAQLAQVMHPNYYYWFQLRTQEGIKSLSCSLTETAYSEAERPPSRTPQAARLPLKIFPNPFNPDTTISFQLPASGRTTIKIYNIKGQLVQELMDEELPPGNHQTTWNGKDGRGKTVASGLYLVRINSGNMSSTRKAILMK